MNKKFINLLLASVLTVGSVQVFTSCKDNEADLRNVFSLQYETLESRVTANEAAIGTLSDELKGLNVEITKEINATKEELKVELEKFDEKFEEALKEQEGEAGKVSNELAEYILKTDGELKDLQTQITANLNRLANFEADSVIVNERLRKLEIAQNLLDGKVTTLEGLTKALGDRAGLLEGRVGILEGSVGELGDSVGRLDGRVTELDKLAVALGVKVGDLEKELSTLTDSVNSQAAKLLVVEGVLNQTKEELEQLTIDFNSYKAATDGRLDILEKFMKEWESALPGIKDKAEEAFIKANFNEAKIKGIEESIETLKGQIKDLTSADEGFKEEIAAIKAVNILQQQQIDGILENLKGLVSSNDFDEAIKELKAEDAAIRELVEENYLKAIAETQVMVNNALAEMNEKYDGLKEQVTDLEGQFNSQQKQLTNLDEFTTNMNIEVEKNKTAIDELQNSIDEANSKIEELSEALGAVTERVEEVAGRITSIVLQGTYDEVFGTMRLPLGIQSNLLVSYFGEVANGSGQVTFPLVEQTASTYDGQSHNALTEQEANDLGVSNAPDAVVPIETISGLFMKEAADGNGYLGKVYATINPSSVNVQDPKFTYNLVNSRGQKVAEPITFVPSDEMLAFGYSRADNGFYEAEATVKIDEGSINSIRFHFDDKLKATVKDILKSPRASANVQTVAKLANAVYEQLNGFLPAIGVEATWKDSQNGDMKVTSNYGIATATVKPLSFGFLYGVTPGKHIPNIMPALDKIKDKFNVTFDELKNKITITLYDPNDPTSGFHIDTPEGGWVTKPVISIDFSNVQVENPEPVVIAPIYDEETGRLIYEGQEIPIDISSSMDEVITQLQASLDSSLSGIGDSFDGINNQLDNVINSISKQVNDLLSNMQTEIDSTIDSVLADIKDRVNGAFNNNRVNSIINRLDGIINKLNNMMDNANYYLQPVLLYSANGDSGIVSSSEAWPTVMVVNGSDNAVAIMPTTYTYETVVPAFKKYVAVTKVWKNGDKSKQNKEEIREDANDSNSNMNKVINSNVREVALKLQKGFTYEVFYQAVDYSGVVSGRKYYICVK